MEEITTWQQVADLALSAGATVLFASLSLVLAWGRDAILAWLASLSHSAAFKCATQKIFHHAQLAVDEIEQTVVRQLKADGQWDRDTARMARDQAVAVIKHHLGEVGLNELKDCLGLGLDDLEGMFRSYVEAAVKRTSNGLGPHVGLGK